MTLTHTATVLEKILANTRLEVAARQSAVPLAAIMHSAAAARAPRNFLAALSLDSVALIAEIKHASPSRGVLIDPFDPLALAQTYAANGAAAISILTDERFFQGHLEHLRAVRQVSPLPILRKDFMIDAYQIYESRAAGADAILLIVAALEDAQLQALHALAGSLGMAAVVEVHNAGELERTLGINPTAIGINNRDLKTFQVSTATTIQLAARIPAGVVIVAESGILHAADVRRMGAAGAHAVLVGEGLLQAPDIAARVREFSSQPRLVSHATS